MMGQTGVESGHRCAGETLGAGYLVSGSFGIALPLRPCSETRVCKGFLPVGCRICFMGLGLLFRCSWELGEFLWFFPNVGLELLFLKKRFIVFI